MNRETNIARFEAELARIHRHGIDKLMAFIRKSDFYTAPASTRFHLSCEGGLLQHSLNVLDAMRCMMTKESDGLDESGNPKIKYHYTVAGQTVATIPEESLIIIALLHDICKTYFYTTSTRNVKNEKTGKWEKAPFYTVSDKMPLGHGAKSAMIVKQYIELTTPEMYAIWWHMGFTDATDTRTLTQAIEQYPIILAAHTADMMASSFMEGEKGNRENFIPATGSDEGQAGEYADAPPTEDDAAEFQEVIPYATV